MRFARSFSVASVLTGLLVVGLLEPGVSALWGQTIPPASLHVTGQSVQFQVQGPVNSYLRVDSSPDLFNWLPVDLFFNTGAAHTTSDSANATNAAQFYQAYSVDSDLRIVDFSPANGPPGTQVQISGQFYPAAGQYVVDFGGAVANVVSGTSTRLVVTVPASAQSGQINVTATNGMVTSTGVFIVSSNAIVRLTPPAGISTSGFTVMNFYGVGTLVPGTSTDYSIPVRYGLPTMTYASVPGQETNLFFCAICFDASQTIVMNEVSTAQALVFQNNNLFTTDPNLGATVMGIIKTNAAVQTFAQTLGAAMVSSGQPFQDSGVSNAFQTAVLSVLNSEGFGTASASAAAATASAQAAAKLTKTAQAKVSNPNATSVYELEYPGTKYLQLTTKGLKLNMEIDAEAIFSPVDWVVVFQDIDVDAAFPGGKTDFDAIWRTWETVPRTYPTRNYFTMQRNVGSDLATSRLNVVKTIEKAYFKALFPKVGDSSVTLPSGPGTPSMYLVRAVGPSTITPQDYSYVNANLQDLYLRAVGINLASAAIELASLVVDDSGKDAVKTYAEYQGLAISIIKAAGGVRNADDFKRAAYELSIALIQDYLKSNLKNAVVATLQFEAGNLDPINSKLKTASAVGQLVERATGLFRTTSLETTLVTVGDPFSLPVTVQPSTAAPGQIVTVQFFGATSLKPFDTNNPAEVVTFEGNTYFNGVVKSVSGPDANGFQSLSVQIPISLGTSANGPYTMYVITQGRKGTANFTVSNAAALSTVKPLQGFAPATNFNGAPYPGTAVRLQGALFTATDTYLFAGGTSGVAATSVQANSSSGDVTVNVPTGAQTGPIQILHQTTNGVLTIPGPVFTVLGAPKINAVQPPFGAPIGGYLNLSVDQAGTDPNLILLQLTGTSPQSVSVLNDGILVGFVPNGSVGGALSVTTPAGTDQVPYNVYPAAFDTNSPGAIITVGGTSTITLARAVAFANGDAVPNQPEAMSGISTYYIDTNNPALWQLGRNYQNTISVSGSVGGDVNFPTRFITVSGGNLAGNIVISGNNNTFSGVSFSGTLSVTGGSNNLVSINFNGPTTISSSNNVVSGGATAPVIVSGENNSFVFPYPLFKGVAGNGLTITGNRNTGTINCQSNTGDGLVINGGKFNTITVNQSLGNGGNGATLTGGAEGNHVTLGSGTSGTQQGFGVANTGNKGHGVALIGNAVANTISGLGPNLSGNGLDGLLADGPGVTLNYFGGTCSYNGRNGMTLTNGAYGNTVGTVGGTLISGGGVNSLIAMDYNAGSGVVFANCGANTVAALCQSNRLYGCLASGVKAAPASFLLIVDSVPFGGVNSVLHIAGNGLAGLRLENGTTGMNIAASLSSDQNGVELDGMDVATNQINASVVNAKIDGAYIHNGAHNNDITLSVGGSLFDGIFVLGASNNIFRVSQSDTNGGSGIHVGGGASGNQFVSSPGQPFSGFCISNMLDGFLLDSGAHDNLFDGLVCNGNHQDGVAFSGSGVSSNLVTRAFAIQNNGRDGVRFEQGATNNVISSATEDDANLDREVQISGNAVAGVHITDVGTGGNLVRRSTIGGYPGGQPFGVVAENGANVGEITRSTITQNGIGVLIQSGANNGILHQLIFDQNTNAAVVVANGSGVLIGGFQPQDQNAISGSLTGIELSGAMATNNVVVNNVIQQATNAVYLHTGAGLNQITGGNILVSNAVAVRIEGASNNLVSSCVIQSNTIAGIVIDQGAAANSVAANTISANPVGVLVTDLGSLANKITDNSITGNGTLGIQLANGGNNLIPPPSLISYTNLLVRGVSGAEDDSRIEIFGDPGNEGQTLLGAGLVANGQFSVELTTDPATLGLGINLTATVTDPEGNTSQFGGFTNPQSLLKGARMIFSSGASGHTQLYLWQNGSPSLDLSQPTITDQSPALASSAGCDRVVFSSFRNGGFNIFVMDAVTNAVAQQVTTGNSDFTPAWLVPCQSVVFASLRKGNSQIYTVNLDGSSLLRVATNSATEITPCATPDATRILFISNRSGTNGLWVVNANGSNPQQLGNPTGAPGQPCISPDGSLIALTVAINGATEIAVMKIDGTGFLQLTSDGKQATHPTWLPDGRTILFSSNRSANGAPQLYSIDRSGANLALLPTSPLFPGEPTVRGP